MTENKKIVTLVGPSGSGKTTMINEMFSSEQVLISTVTRNKRPGEVEGKDYYFVSNEHYQKLIDNDELVQDAVYMGNHYGVTKKEIEDKLKSFDVVIIAVVQETVKDYRKYANENGYDFVDVFLKISRKELIKHFENRSETEAEKQKRIDNYEAESSNVEFYDKNHILSADNWNEAKSKFEKLINKKNEKQVNRIFEKFIPYFKNLKLWVQEPVLTKIDNFPTNHNYVVQIFDIEAFLNKYEKEIIKNNLIIFSDDNEKIDYDTAVALQERFTEIIEKHSINNEKVVGVKFYSETMSRHSIVEDLLNSGLTDEQVKAKIIEERRKINNRNN